MRRIAIVGPESSGKTTLAEALARELAVPLVPEAARAFLGGLGRHYQEQDLLAIAREQAASEERLAEGHPSVLICDTDLITIRIWSEEKYGRCHPWIVEQTEERHYDLWLLCRPDMPWEPDPLRENPLDRDRLFGVYEAMLAALGKPHRIVEGPLAQRMNTAVEAIHGLRASA